MSTSYPERTVADVLASYDLLRRNQRAADEALLNALVDVINRSPFGVAEWAVSLDMTLPELVETCHRKERVTETFRLKVRNFFDRFRNNPRPSWDEVAPHIKQPSPILRPR